MNPNTCPICDANNAHEVEFAEEVVRNGKSVHVEGLRQFECGSCGAVISNDEQSRWNLVQIQLAFGEAPEFVLPKEIRAWRKKIGLTQRECSRIFGGGGNSFSKYETGSVLPSEAMDNLLWLTMRYPRLLVDLAERRFVPLSAEIVQRCGYLIHSRENFTLTAATLKSVGDVIAQHRELFSKYWEAFHHSRFQTAGIGVTSSHIRFAANDGHFPLSESA